jgi:hypothetical protein
MFGLLFIGQLHVLRRLHSRHSQQCYQDQCFCPCVHHIAVRLRIAPVANPFTGASGQRRRRLSPVHQSYFPPTSTTTPPGADPPAVARGPQRDRQGCRVRPCRFVHEGHARDPPMRLLTHVDSDPRYAGSRPGQVYRIQCAGGRRTAERYVDRLLRAPNDWLPGQRTRSF